MIIQKKVTGPLTVLCVLLGIMIGMQLKTVRNSNATGVTVQRVNELTNELAKLTEENLILQEKINTYETRIKSYEDTDQDVQRVLKEELDELKIVSGLVPVEGRGIVVTLTDGKAKNGQNVDANAYLIHDEDILTVVNELYAAGAEAIAINGHRLISTSSIRCIGPVVSVDGQKMAPPYAISAIGDSDTLEAALKLSGGVVDALKPWGIEVTIKKSASIMIEKYEHPLSFKEATVYEEVQA